MIDESQERVEQREKKRGEWSTPSNPLAMVRDEELERVTHKEH